jgi:hypothetical protein
MDQCCPQLRFFIPMVRLYIVYQIVFDISEAMTNLSFRSEAMLFCLSTLANVVSNASNEGQFLSSEDNLLITTSLIYNKSEVTW